MGFFSDLLNIESSQFKTILKPTAVKEFSKENATSFNDSEVSEKLATKTVPVFVR